MGYLIKPIDMSKDAIKKVRKQALKVAKELTQRNIKQAKKEFEQRVKEEAAKQLGGSPNDYILNQISPEEY